MAPGTIGLALTAVDALDHQVAPTPHPAQDQPDPYDGPGSDDPYVYQYPSVALPDGRSAAVLQEAYMVSPGEFLTDRFLLIYNADGSFAASAPVTRFDGPTNGGSPLPFLVESDPTIRENADGTLTVTSTRYYTPTNPDYPDYPAPPGQQTLIEQYDHGGHLLSRHFVDFDKTGETATYDPTTGKLASDYLRHPDGSFETEAYGITGKSYVDQEAAYGIGGRLIHLVRHYANGSTAFEQTVNADGSQTAVSYDTSHRTTTAVSYASNGSRESLIYTYNGNSNVPTTIREALYDTNGAGLRVDVTNADGTHTQTAVASGVTLTSTAGADDVLRGATVGNDTFVFGKGDGHDTLLYFKPGSGSGHDVVDLSESGIASYQQLQSHLSHVALGTEITLDDHSTILLQAVSQTALTSANFIF